MVAGDLVNTASRIQSVAEPGQRVRRRATRRATEQTVVYEDAGAFELKGKAEPAPLWRALRVVSGAARLAQVEGLEAPFVGRDRELRQIKDLFHACADERRRTSSRSPGSPASASPGSPGSSTSTSTGSPQTSYWHRGRCLPYGEGVTYWALADMVRMRCRIAEDEEPALGAREARARRSTSTSSTRTSGASSSRGSPTCSASASRRRATKQDLFAAWRLFFERLADVYPTVLAFEDMQWADASLLDFVEYLLEWSRNSPLFVITLARPGAARAPPDLGRGPAQLHLALPRAAARRGDGGAAGRARPRPARRAARADPRPRRGRAALRGRDGADAARPRPARAGGLGLPADRRDRAARGAGDAARADRRPARRPAAGGAARCSRTAPCSARRSRARRSPRSPGADEELEPLLASLVRKEVLGLQADPRSPEHGQYGFLQDLVRHVAYETLSKRERRARHLARPRT